MAPKDKTDLKGYQKCLYTQKNPFFCPHCHESVLPRNYENHCKVHHHLNPLICCVWCFGKLTWPLRNKCLNGRHLKTCAQKFMNTLRRTLPISFDKTVLCPAKDLFGRTPDPQPRAYEPIWPVTLPPNTLVFDMESLNQALSCLQLYLRLHDTTYWTHAVVRQGAFASFLEAIDSDEGRTRTLPFSCWCDAGDLCHRHMIVVAPSQTHFEKCVWKKIDVSNRPVQHFRCKSREPIQSALHLMNALGYVSRREDSHPLASHYYIFQSLPVDYKLVLATQWAGGLAQLLHQQWKNLAWEELIRAPFFLEHGQWQMRVKDIPGIRLGAVLPVSRDFVPCSEPTEYALHLLQGDMLYFERSPILAHLPPDFWLREQAARGNMLFDAVGESWHTPHPFHQKLIRAFKPDVDRIAELESEGTRLQAEVARLSVECEEWRERWAGAERERKCVQEKLNLSIEHVQRLYEETIARQKREMRDMRAEFKRKLKEKDEKLKEKNEEIDQLKRARHI